MKSLLSETAWGGAEKVFGTASAADKPSAVVRYGVALGCVLLAFAIRYWLTPVLGEELPFMMFIAASLVAAWYGGAVAGIVALMLGLLMGNHFFLASGPTQLQPRSIEVFRLLRYLFTATLGIILIEVLHRGRRRTEAALEEVKREMLRRQKAEQELLQAQELLRGHAAELERHVAQRTVQLTAAVNSLEGILHHIAHNLRAPLRAMNSYSAILVNEHAAGLDSTAQGYCRYISAAAQRMDTLIQDLLEYGHISEADVRLAEVSLQRALEQALSALSSQIALKKAKIDLAGPFPDVSTDARLLHHVLLHLLDNSLKFVGPGTNPQVRIRSERRGGSVWLWIEDNGIGIEPQYQERIFRAFETLHADGMYEGNGIGLAVVKQAMERMGGRTGVESIPGKGSRFWIEFPPSLPALTSQ